MGGKEACPDQTALLDIPEDLEPDLSKTCWLQRVPRKLRKVNEAAYTPTMVSIGPFHHGKPALKAMEDHKAKYYQKFWERNFCKHITENDIRDFTEELGGHRGQRIRNSYAGTFDQPVNDVGHFLKVILRDSCFIFELFLRNYEQQPEDIKDYILRTPWLRDAIELDLIMVENQVPYFVFTELFDFILDKKPANFHGRCYLSKQRKGSERHRLIMDMTCKFFHRYYKFGKVTSQSAGIRNDELMQRSIKHFTDLVRQFMRPDNYGGSSEDARCLYSAKELDRAGVKFVSCSNKFLADIQFIKKGKILELPRFQVGDNTECLLRNVMALEQCLYPNQTHICNYISLLNQLINTDEDVELLVYMKVVDNWLGSNKEVADLINTLGKEIEVTRYCYAGICKQLNSVHKIWWNVAMATLKRVYFKDIWTGSSTVVAIVVLIFSIVSVIATVKDSFILSTTDKIKVFKNNWSM